MHRLFLEAKLTEKDHQTALQEANARAYEMESICLDPLAHHLHFFFLLNLLWSRHVKPSPAIGEKSEDSDSRKPKMYNLFLSGNRVKYKLRSTVQGSINHNVCEVVTNYAKNLPRALRILSTSWSARWARQRCSRRRSRSHPRGGVVVVACVERQFIPSQPPSSLFFFGGGRRPDPMQKPKLHSADEKPQRQITDPKSRAKAP